MSLFMFDIQGKLNDIHLSNNRALWPLFETVVNAIQSIEDSQNKNRGEIRITAQRELFSGYEGQYEQLSMPIANLPPFTAFSVSDNGTGFDAKNYHSFQTAYSTLKIQKGCKGIGRFLWLKAFASVDIDSIFIEGEKYFRRQFMFSPSGISPEDNIVEIEPTELKTTVKLNDFDSKYRRSVPVDLNVIAKRIIEHCLPFFIVGNCPRIVLTDNIDTIDLNQYYDEIIKDSLAQDRFEYNDTSFTIYHLRLPDGATANELHLCANKLDVLTVDLKKFVPDLQKKINPISEPKGFYYAGYVTSDYLDNVVNTTRTAFEFDEKENQAAMAGAGRDSIAKAAIPFVLTYLSEYLDDIKKQKRRQIDDFVAYDRPTYRYLLNKRPDVYEKIPAGLRPDELEMALHQQVQIWETEIKEQGQELERAAKENTQAGDKTYQDIFDEYWAGVTNLGKTYLAEYVARRKTLLTILEDALKIQDSGRFKKENVVHTLICPMQHTSDDVAFEEMNLWIVDERLAYHKYLASDKTLRSIPLIDSESRKEPDIAVFDRPFAYTDSDEPFSNVSIVEFKKPDNDQKDPIDQVGEYIDLIREGKGKKANGQSLSVVDGTLFHCYIICDLTPKMQKHCLTANLFPTADNLGFTGYHTVRRAYFNVISYKKLLIDAKRRNQIFFDKLFTPKVSEVIHKPDSETEES